jgi:hypothetical protein
VSDALEVKTVALEPELMDFRQTHLDEPGDSDLSQSSEEGCLEAFEEIVEQYKLEKFSTFLRDAQKAALALEKTKGRALRA